MANYLGQPLGLQVAQTQARAPQDLRINIGDPMQYMQSLNAGIGLAQGLQQAPLKRQMMETQADAMQTEAANAQVQIQAAREKARRISLFQGANDVLTAGPEGAMAALEARRARLEADGLPTDETDAAIAAFQADPAGFMENTARTVQQGRQEGFLGGPGGYGGLKPTARMQEFAQYQALPDGPDKEAFGMIIGAIPKPLGNKTSTVATPTGVNVIDQNGNVVNRVIDPDKKAEFDATLAERKQILAEKQRAEKEAIRKTKIEKQDAEESKRMANTTTTRALDLVRKLQRPGAIDAVTGTWDTWTPTLLPSSQDIIKDGLELKNLLTMDNLGLMSGVLSESDIKILASAASGLPIDEDGFTGSEGAVLDQLKVVEGLLKSKLKSAVRRGTFSQDEFDALFVPDAANKEVGAASIEELERIAAGG